MLPFAAFDVLYLVDRITEVTAARTADPLPGAADLEVQSLAYFSSMLHMWSNDGPWGYEFFVTKDSEPFSTALADASRTLKARGSLIDMGLLNALSSPGRTLLASMLDVGTFAERRILLDAAVTTAKFLTIPLVVRGIGREPTLRSSSTSRPLLDESAVGILSDYLDAVRDLMGSNFTLGGLAEVILNYFLVEEDGSAVWH